MGKVAKPAPINSPGLEVRVDHPVGKALPTNPNSLEHSVTRQLVHDQGGVDFARLLVGVGDHASVEKYVRNTDLAILLSNIKLPNEVRLGGVEGGH